MSLADEPGSTTTRLASRRVRGSLAAATGLAVFATWGGTHLGGTSVVRDFDDAATAFAACGAALLCLQAGRRHRGRVRHFWLLLAGAAAAWTLSETLWAVYDAILQVPVPVPSWADVGYLSAIP